MYTPSHFSELRTDVLRELIRRRPLGPLIVAAPTWNYVAVHAYGKPRVIRDAPAEYVDKMLQAIAQLVQRTLPTS